MRTKLLFQLIVALFVIVMLGCPTPVTPPEDTVINIAAIPGLTAPVFGATPVTVITETAQYTGTVAWAGTPATFAASTVYTATITLTAKAGYTLTGVAANLFTVTGTTSDSNPANSGVVTAVFPATGTAPATVINLAAIPGVTAPAYGATPVTTITETVQYTGTVAWNGSPATFAASTVYTATITLTAKAGYTLTGVAADFFTVAGATSATNPVNSGVVTVVFPATEAAPDTVINIAAIPGVTAPVLGATPVTTITATAQYTGTVAWNGSPATFAASTVYTATITLTAKAGFTLTGVAANSFTVAGAAATNAVNSGVVTAVFPATLFTLTMIIVPAGRFQWDATVTNISVITQPYRMSAHEITRAQYAALFTTDPSNVSYSSGTGDPVQMTNWYRAIAFCNKLSIAEGLTPVYAVTGVNFSTLTFAAIPNTSDATWDAATATWTNNGYRLPTEMEWMWAAMGAPADGQSGGTNTTGYAKAFSGSTGSNSIGDYAVFGYPGSETGRTTTERSNPVGSKTANELGLYDMSGNVSEWTWDWYGAYPTGTQTDYRGAASGSSRVLRGGSWLLVAFYCTVASPIGRISFYPDYDDYEIGFRVVCP